MGGSDHLDSVELATPSHKTSSGGHGAHGHDVEVPLPFFRHDNNYSDLSY